MASRAQGQWPPEERGVKVQLASLNFVAVGWGEVRLILIMSRMLGKDKDT